MPKFNLGRLLEGTAYGVMNEILAEFRSDDGYALPSRYEVVLLPPQGSRAKPQGALSNIFAKVMQENTGEGTTRKTGLQCESISFPGRNIDTAEDTNIYGPVRQIAQGVTYADLSATFQCSSDLRERKFFETWQRLAYNPQTWAMQYYDSYTGSLDIYQLDNNDRRRYGVRLVECYPKVIGDQSLDYGSVNTLQTVQVSFAYRYYKSLADEANLPKPLGDRVRDVIGDTVERQILSKIPKVLSKL